MERTRTITMSVLIIGMIMIAGLVVFTVGCTFKTDSKGVLMLATTTSTANSGLLDHILPEFEEEYNCMVKVTPVGTGQALEMGRNGDADVLLVHAPSSEIEFVEDGYGTARTLVMYNQFIIVGPGADPAGLKGTSNTTAAMETFFEGEIKFVSRGDDSGTHKKEKSLWEAAGYDYATEVDIIDNDWYLSVSAGMGDTLTRANELEAYTLADEGTYYSYQSDLDLDIIVSGDSQLFNQYSVVPVNPAKHSHVNEELANDFVEWLTSPEVQQMIADFTADGKQLFTPNAEV